MSDYFSTDQYGTLSALLVHAEVNHENVKKFARLGRTNCKGHFRFAELAVEDKAHRHAILRRAEVLRASCPEAEATYNRIRLVCDKTATLKV